MTRSKQTTWRKPWPRLNRNIIHEFPDHSGETYKVVRGTPNCCNPKSIVKLSVHLYSLRPLTPSREEVATRLLSESAFSSWGNARNRWPRVDVYAPLGSIEECIEHHRREKIYRREALEKMHCEAVEVAEDEEQAQEAVLKLRGKEPLPHIVPTWCRSPRFWRERDYWDDRYRSFILVIPEECTSWDDILRRGLWMVKFDQDAAPDMETDVHDDDPEEYALIEDREPWVWVDKTKYGPPISIKRVSVCEGNCEFNNAPFGVHCAHGQTESEMPKFERKLYDEWANLTTVLWDCTYTSPVCEFCDQGPCEVDMDEHYFDDDGQCVACRRHIEYRRRSKRIAKMIRSSSGRR
ncbi:hypothetical protein BDV23DRAFT_171621 [Aspergillus alliaceus]|uniref:Uncharacterized protein n=1 Tax=Petromyces alliaceus TaxID=209559 RepID=A0A5N7CBY6_PETAA|nr:hypothetical protein BDV23DRAFT_171621 [Aspergillus alliaceus]